MVVLIIWGAKRRWAWAGQFFVIWILLEGAARKWIPGLGKPGYFIGHLILAGAYLGYLFDRLPQGKPLFPTTPFNWILLALFGWGMLEIFNAGELGILVWLLGMITYFFYAPLVYLVPYAFPSKEKLLVFLKIFTLMCLPLLLVGVVQYYSPGSSWINKVPWGDWEDHVYFAGQHVRISSTFGNNGAYAVFLPFLVLLVLYLLSLKRLSKKWSILLYVILGGAFLNALMTGSRHTVAFTLIVFILYIILSGMLSLEDVSRLLPRLVVGGLVVLLFFSMTTTGQDAIDSFRYRGVEDVGGRLKTYSHFYRFESLAGIFGIGIGATFQGNQQISDARIATGTHAEVERIFVELGPIGFALAYGLRVVVLWQLWLLYRRLHDRELRLLALVGFLYLLQVFHGSMVYNYVANKLFWFIAGFILLLPRLDQIQIKKKSCPLPG